jgi:hypothetical protein
VSSSSAQVPHRTNSPFLQFYCIPANYVDVMHPTFSLRLILTDTCVKVYWFLSDKDDWRLDDGLFKKEEFFHMIVCLFETDPDDDWVEDTLQWWNS